MRLVSKYVQNVQIEVPYCERDLRSMENSVASEVYVYTHSLLLLQRSTAHVRGIRCCALSQVFFKVLSV